MQTTHYETLSHYVQNGQLELNWVIGVPRSMGNALHLLLTQSNEIDAQLNEPFHVMELKTGKYVLYANREKENVALDQAFEKGCGYILEKFKPLSLKGKKIRLMIHDVSQTLSAKDFKKIAKITKQMIFTIRDPIQQLLSLLTRFTNDQWSEPGKDLLKTIDVLELMDDKTNLTEYVTRNTNKLHKRFIEKSEKELQEFRIKTLRLVAEDFNASWEQIHYFILKAKKYSHSNQVFDAQWLFDNPESHIRELCSQIHIPYKSDMIHKWTKCVGREYDCVITRSWGELAHTNAWNGPARNSTGLSKNLSHYPIEIDQLPLYLRSSIQKCCQIYQVLLPKKKGRL